MHRNDLISKIGSYIEKNPQSVMAKTCLSFVENNSDCFERSNLEGHITGSCLLLSPDQKKVLLTHHRKIQKWLQLGGHCDGNEDTLAVAIQEAKEESGISEVSAISPEIYSIHIHDIPAFKEVPTHLHYDIVYVLQAHSEDYKVSEESMDLRWVPIHSSTPQASFSVEETVLELIYNLPMWLKEHS